LEVTLDMDGGGGRIDESCSNKSQHGKRPEGRETENAEEHKESEKAVPRRGFAAQVGLFGHASG
jgi:hypothetical protein